MNRITAILQPFLRLLGKRDFAISRWSVLRALLTLAILKRIRSTRTIHIRLGKYVIHAPDYHMLSFLIKEKFVDEQYLFESRHPNPVIIDCGANIGVSVIYFKCLYPEATIHCFEPLSEAYAYLQENVSCNKLQNVHLYNKALSDIGGVVHLYTPADGNTINASLVNNAATRHYSLVDSIRLSQFISNIPVIDLIKMDVEGAEHSIVADLTAQPFQTEKITMMIIEYHYETAADPERLDGYLLALRNSGFTTSTAIIYPSHPASGLLIRASRK